MDDPRPRVADGRLHHAAAQAGGPMSDVSRRDALKLLGAVPLVGAMDWSAPSLERATRMGARLHEEDAAPAPSVGGRDWSARSLERATRMVARLHEEDAPPAAYTPKFFTPHEWRTV